MKNLRILFLLFSVIFTATISAQPNSSGGIVVPTGFKITAPQPIDDRTAVADSLSLLNIPNKYPGLQSYSVADNAVFVYDGTIWNKVGAGGNQDLESVMINGNFAPGNIDFRNMDDFSERGLTASQGTDDRFGIVFTSNGSAELKATNDEDRTLSSVGVYKDVVQLTKSGAGYTHFITMADEGINLTGTTKINEKNAITSINGNEAADDGSISISSGGDSSLQDVTDNGKIQDNEFYKLETGTQDVNGAYQFDVKLKADEINSIGNDNVSLNMNSGTGFKVGLDYSEIMAQPQYGHIDVNPYGITTHFTAGQNSGTMSYSTAGEIEITSMYGTESVGAISAYPGSTRMTAKDESGNSHVVVNPNRVELISKWINVDGSFNINEGDGENELRIFNDDYDGGVKQFYFLGNSEGNAKQGFLQVTPGQDWEINLTNSTDNWYTGLFANSTGIAVTSMDEGLPTRGLYSAMDFSETAQDLDFVQKKYVDDKLLEFVPIAGNHPLRQITGPLLFNNASRIEDVNGNLEIHRGGLPESRVKFTSKTEFNADMEIKPTESSGNLGLILSSPNGSRWKVTISDSGVLTTTPL
ncbi:hypothetical protein ACI6PS_03615 [Flavobacterium sp. PLA-1-15]|uniref:hypothetical protein n=1 Tax=Flavobacterium sp. PLA-1-15 TaxID=3380533 RepID=UPI003B7DB660